MEEKPYSEREEYREQRETRDYVKTRIEYNTTAQVSQMYFSDEEWDIKVDSEYGEVDIVYNWVDEQWLILHEESEWDGYEEENVEEVGSMLEAIVQVMECV